MVGKKARIKPEFADLINMTVAEQHEPVTVLEVIERETGLPLVRFKTVLGRELHLFLDAIEPSTLSLWKGWMVTTLERRHSVATPA